MQQLQPRDTKSLLLGAEAIAPGDGKGGREPIEQDRRSREGGLEIVQLG